MTKEKCIADAKAAVERRDAKRKAHPEDAEDFVAFVDLPGDIIDQLAKSSTSCEAAGDLLRGLKSHSERFKDGDGKTLPAMVLADQFLALCGPATAGG